MPKIKRSIKRMLVFLVEDVSLLRYMVFFAATIILFGIAYTLLTPIGHGIGRDLKPLPDITFPADIPTGIYFSTVTISSLGYGDMHPMGFSKVLICMEVLIGLAVIGITIAKVTSRRLSYHVSRLFSFDAQKRLEGIASKFDTSRSNLAEIMPELADTYQDTPGERSTDEDRGPLNARFQRIVRDLQLKCIELRDYFSDEMAQGNYLQIAPASSIVRVGEAIDDTFFMLGQLLTSLSPQAKAEILVGRNRHWIFEAIDSQKQVCATVRKQATEPDTKIIFHRIETTCNLVLASYFAIQEELQPDQVLQGTNEPQESPEVDNEQTDSS